jgi:hypothetical protein
MKPKTKAFADKIINDKKISNTQAYLDTHRTESRKVANVEASKLMAKPSVQIYLKRHEQLAKNKIVSLLGAKDETALKAAQDILDRNLGKSIQRQQTTNTNLNLNIDASKELSEDFTAYLKAKTAT